VTFSRTDSCSNIAYIPHDNTVHKLQIITSIFPLQVYTFTITISSENQVQGLFKNLQGNIHAFSRTIKLTQNCTNKIYI